MLASWSTRPITILLPEECHRGLLPRYSIAPVTPGATRWHTFSTYATNDDNDVSQILALLESEKANQALASLLEKVNQCQNDGLGNEPPHISLVEAALEKLVSAQGTTTEEMANQAQQLLQTMKEIANSTQNSELQPTLACYRDLIQLYSRTKSPEETEQLYREEVLQGTKSNSTTTSGTPSSNKALQALQGQCLNHVLTAWSQSGHIDAGIRCQNLLTKSHSNPQSHHLLNEAWIHTVTVNAKKLHAKQFLNAAQNVQANIDFMNQRYHPKSNPEWLPHPHCNAFLIQAYSAGGAPQEAQAILDRIPQQQQTTQLYNSVLEAYARRGNGTEASLVLSKWVSRCQVAREKAGKDPSVTQHWQPNLQSCWFVIQAWGCRSEQHRAAKAEQIVQRMHELQAAPEEYLRVLPAPTTEIYNALLMAWANHRHHKPAKAATNAERILELMHRVDERGNVEGAVEDKDNPCWPNAYSYELVALCFARYGFNLPDRNNRVNKLVRRMKHWRIQPTERFLELVELCQENGRRLEE